MARPIAARAWILGGMSALCYKEGTDPCRCHAVCCTAAHHSQRIHQRWREWPAPRLRGVARRAGVARADQPGQPGSRLHNRTSENNADAQLKQQSLGHECGVVKLGVVVVTQETSTLIAGRQLLQVLGYRTIIQASIHSRNAPTGEIPAQLPQRRRRCERRGHGSAGRHKRRCPGHGCAETSPRSAWQTEVYAPR